MAKVLVVDDEPAFAEFAKLLLEGMGHKTILCLDSTEAVALAAYHKPDVIITDLNMPDLDGLALIEQLKAKPETRPIPVMLASSSTDKSDRAEAQRLGAVYSIIKPLQAPMLKTLMDHLLKAPPP
jgi:two-component system chemotaxis response regulator CheY